ncbi:methyltransferase domain-containing protein [Arthrobacter sp. UM1]|nr:methyltransferase domain-containing protein [Arthrobacter sp. UM1]
MVGAGTRFTADTGEMIAARERVQSSGLYAPLKTALHELLPHGPLLDAGCGTGYYAHGLDSESVLALDLSKHAVRRAARLPRTLALVWDLWRPIPLAEDAVAAVLNVFAPHNFPEFARVLAPGGSVVVVTPAEGHLAEARELGIMLGQAGDKAAALDAAAAETGLRRDGRSVVEARLETEPGVLADLAFMGPAGHHSTREEILARILEARGATPGGPPTAAVTARFEISRYGLTGSAAGDRPASGPMSR